MTLSPGAKQIVDELDAWATNHRPPFRAAWLGFGIPGGQWPEAEKLTRAG
jgi:hypothetical protein